MPDFLPDQAPADVSEPAPGFESVFYFAVQVGESPAQGGSEFREGEPALPVFQRPHKMPLPLQCFLQGTDYVPQPAPACAEPYQDRLFGPPASCSHSETDRGSAATEPDCSADG